jgi:hypothetical protein
MWSEEAFVLGHIYLKLYIVRNLRLYNLGARQAKQKP